jgi:hypothetical protein
MTNQPQPAIVTISVVVRHSPDCPKKHPKYDWYSRKCNCRKALYIFENGQNRTVSAKTRTWEDAEKFALAERNRRDPVKQRLREIEEQEAHKATLQQTQDTTILDATERWVLSQRPKTTETAKIYERAARSIRDGAADRGIERLSGITANELNQCRGTWSPNSEKEYSRMDRTTQSHFQGRLKQLCRWGMELWDTAIMEPL